MVMRRGKIADHVHPYLEVGPFKFKRVQEFKYLGSILTQKKDELTKKKQDYSPVICYGLNKALKA